MLVRISSIGIRRQHEGWSKRNLMHRYEVCEDSIWSMLGGSLCGQDSGLSLHDRRTKIIVLNQSMDCESVPLVEGLERMQSLLGRFQVLPACNRSAEVITTYADRPAHSWLSLLESKKSKRKNWWRSAQYLNSGIPQNFCYDFHGFEPAPSEPTMEVQPVRN